MPPSLLQAAGIGNDAVYFVSTPDEAIAVSHQVKGDTEKKPLQIQFANFLAPCFAPAISSQLSWLSEMEGSSNLREMVVPLQLLLLPLLMVLRLLLPRLRRRRKNGRNVMTTWDLFD